MNKIYLLLFLLLGCVCFGQGLPPFVRNSFDTNDQSGANAAVRQIAQLVNSTNQVTLTGVITGVGSNTITVTFSTTGTNNIKSIVGSMNLLTNAGSIKIAGTSLAINSGTVNFQGVDVSPVNIGVAFQFSNNGGSAGGANVTFTGIFNGNAKFLTNGSPALATNSASATDGKALVNHGGNLSLENLQETNVVLTVKTFFTNYTVLSTDTVLFLTGTNQLITIPDAANLIGHTPLVLISSTTTGSFIATNFNGTQTIKGGLSQNVPATNSLAITSNGSNWW